jgi:hypothetical protein
MSAPEIPDIPDISAGRARAFDTPDITASHPFIIFCQTPPDPRTIAKRARPIAVMAAVAMLIALLIGGIAWMFLPVPDRPIGSGLIAPEPSAVSRTNRVSSVRVFR